MFLQKPIIPSPRCHMGCLPHSEKYCSWCNYTPETILTRLEASQVALRGAALQGPLIFLHITLRSKRWGSGVAFARSLRLPLALRDYFHLDPRVFIILYVAPVEIP